MEKKDGIVEEEIIEETTEAEGDEHAEEIPMWLSKEQEESEEESEEQQETGEQIPLAAHVKAKDKLKGRIKESNEELERLKAENDDLKKQLDSSPVKPKPRPKIADFDLDEEFEQALDEWQEQNAQTIVSSYEEKKKQEDLQRDRGNKIARSVENHYERAEKLIADHSISVDVYRSADVAVREAVEAVHKGGADAITDVFIDALGEGSEKVMLYLGRNKKALNEFTSLLAKDNTGLAVASFLGGVKKEIEGVTKRKSTAPPPPSQINGSAESGNAAALRRKYDAAHKKGDVQEAWNLKKEAKAQGVDTKQW